MGVVLFPEKYCLTVVNYSGAEHAICPQWSLVLVPCHSFQRQFLQVFSDNIQETSIFTQKFNPDVQVIKRARAEEEQGWGEKSAERE